MGKYRPDGWLKGGGFQDEVNGQLLDNFLTNAYEAGADAMLEALKKGGSFMTPEQMKLLAPDREHPYGHLVFIPEDNDA